jgi:sodium-dependent phosphate transporter
MPTLHQFDYILAIGTIFAFLDAWNIGANDVANSWTTSVSSRSISYLQAMILGSILEFAGAVGVGARVADTIRTKVVDVTLFEDNPAVLMVGMMSAIVGSALWLTICTKIGLPVSTTHSIMGGVIGMGVATVGADNVTWVNFKSGDISGGVVSVFLAWIIAPCLSAGFAITIFLVTKYAVLLRSNPVMKGLMLVPVYFGITASLLTMLVVWKGGSIDVEDFSNGTISGIIVGVGAAWACLIGIFLVPWLYRIVAKDDWQLRWWHIPQGPLLLRRPEPPAQPEGSAGGIRDFYAGHLTREELEALRNRNSSGSDVETTTETKTKDEKRVGSDNDAEENCNIVPRELNMPEEKKIVGPKPEGKWYSGQVIFWTFKWLLLRGVDQDIVSAQAKRTRLASDLEATHAHVKHYDNRTEYLYTFVQVMTACTASFTHGANDVANAIGPYATIYQVWHEGGLDGSKSPVPTWIL